jgi:hypothetical protein
MRQHIGNPSGVAFRISRRSRACLASSTIVGFFQEINKEQGSVEPEYPVFTPHDDFDAPRPRPSAGVVDGEAVKKMVFIQALPALDEMRLCCCSC